ncbi:MAG: hypothetical protein IH978_00065 [Nitrospinae bacterium]|nr:hypothetical protein [Nitrospinota bacterium]
MRSKPDPKAWRGDVRILGDGEFVGDMLQTFLGLSRREIASYFGVSSLAMTYISRSGKAAVEEHGLMDIF